MKERFRCEAPFHTPDCSGWGTTRDHFTPRSVAKLLRWKKKQIDSPENIQYLSSECHREKDKNTRDIKIQVKQQLKGRFIGFGEHI